MITEQRPSTAVHESEAILSDGSTVHIRPLSPSDRDALREFFNQLSPETKRQRFFNAMPRLADTLLERLIAVDGESAFAFVAIRRNNIVGVGRAHRTEGPKAEVAFTVSDALQGHGIATVLLEKLATYARAVGIEKFVAITQTSNSSMLGVFRHVGYPVVVHHDPEDASMMLVDMTLDADDAKYQEAHRAREHSAAATSLRPLLRPASIAVIGASRNAASPGRRIVDELLKHGYTGRIVPVNPNAKEVAGLPAVSRIGDVHEVFDLAIIAVPAAGVVSAADECGRAGVHGLLVISAGFAEIGDLGKQRQRELLEVCRSYGMRLVGPNCLGMITTDPTVSMHALFTDLEVAPGGISLMSQSGAVAMAIAALAAQRGIGLSSMVSVGNKADVSGNDLLEYWDGDPATKVIALYLESFGNPRTFARRAQDISRRKPIVAIKSARSAAGSRAAASHTGALTTHDATVDALFEQSGVLRVDDLGDLLTLASTLERLPLPQGRRVAVVGNAGGLAILTIDALVRFGLVPAEMQPTTVSRLRQLAPPNASFANPVDLTADANPAQIVETVSLISQDPGVDALIIVHVGVGKNSRVDVERALTDVIAKNDKPIVTLFASSPQERAGQSQVPTVDSPTQAALTLAKMAERFEWLHQRTEPLVPLPIDTLEAIQGVLTDARNMRPVSGRLDAPAASRLLQLAGIAVAHPVFAADADAAVERATQIGYPVCLKAANPDLEHRSDLGAVNVDLADDFQVECAFQAMQKHLGSAMGGAIIQPMAKPGVEMIVGVTHDPAFGPLVMVGAGGREAELWRDISLHLAPVPPNIARQMVASLRSARLLTGFRGSLPADVDALVEVIVKVSQLAVELPELVTLDANPVIVHSKGATAVDVKIQLMVETAR